jgi:hypothetical protein
MKGPARYIILFLSLEILCSKSYAPGLRDWWWPWLSRCDYAESRLTQWSVADAQAFLDPPSRSVPIAEKIAPEFTRPNLVHSDSPVTWADHEAEPIKTFPEFQGIPMIRVAEGFDSVVFAVNSGDQRQIVKVYSVLKGVLKGSAEKTESAVARYQGDVKRARALLEAKSDAVSLPNLRIGDVDYKLAVRIASPGELKVRDGLVYSVSSDFVPGPTLNVDNQENVSRIYDIANPENPFAVNTAKLLSPFYSSTDFYGHVAGTERMLKLVATQLNSQLGTRFYISNFNAKFVVDSHNHTLFLVVTDLEDQIRDHYGGAKRSPRGTGEWPFTSQ